MTTQWKPKDYHLENCEYKIDKKDQKIFLCPRPFYQSTLGKKLEQIRKNKEHKMTKENQKVKLDRLETPFYPIIIQHDLQDLIITKDDLKQLKVLDKPTDTATRLVWIFRTVAYEYSRGKQGCYVTFSELQLFGNSIEANLLENLINAGYKVTVLLNKELIGDCLEIVWG